MPEWLIPLPDRFLRSCTSPTNRKAKYLQKISNVLMRSNKILLRVKHCTSARFSIPPPCFRICTLASCAIRYRTEPIEAMDGGASGGEVAGEGGDDHHRPSMGGRVRRTEEKRAPAPPQGTYFRDVKYHDGLHQYFAFR